jgi:hypothetical protein
VAVGEASRGQLHPGLRRASSARALRANRDQVPRARVRAVLGCRAALADRRHAPAAAPPRHDRLASRPARGALRLWVARKRYGLPAPATPRRLPRCWRVERTRFASRRVGGPEPVAADHHGRCAGASRSYPWPPTIPSSRFGHLPSEPIVYTQVKPRVVVELHVDTAFEQNRWRHACRLFASGVTSESPTWLRNTIILPTSSHGLSAAPRYSMAAG